MDAAHFDIFINALIDELTPSPAPEDDVVRTLFHLLDSPRRVVDDGRLLAVLAAAVRLGNVCDYVIAQAVAAAERAGIPTRKRLRSGAQLLTALGVAPAAAYQAARVGRAAYTLPALTRQHRLGALGIEFVDAVGKGVARVGARVELSDGERAQVVRTLMIQTTPSGVSKKAREVAIAQTAAQSSQGEEVVPVADNADLNEMTLYQNDEGRVAATLDLDALTGEELFAALDPLCRPVPLPDGSPDPRSTDKRRADAFGQLVRTYLSGSGRPTSGGVLPHVTLIRPATAAMEAGEEQGVDMLGFTGPISTVTAELVSCDSTMGTVLVDQDGAPLDVGRSERLFPPHIRKALGIRDRGCAFPGCGRPVSWCDAHHINPWGTGGSTCVDNGVLFCRCHHTMIHHSGWQVYLGPDRHPWFIPPYDRTGPEPPHLRSHARRTLTSMPTAA
ncbi:HNH endonuclease signature motif containing protein [Mycobacterium aquaticum]|uniref:HNH endonuclease n=1 Tax=Mycobacterium aquaticum TaxID=1927124 RepID=A0A1X0AMP9_9MYCO|nr:HNH endonuclease signature motif containing protein [Mycobacterium aquaticum]ORA31357.1 HNH endonuclease [Mycobacterium aquaticum]